MQDPLSFNIPTGVDTSYPLIPEGDYKLQITESQYKPSRFDDSILTWEPKLTTADPVTSVDSKPIAPGTQVYLQYPFDLAEQKEPKFPGQWIKTICLAVNNIFGYTDETRPPVNRELLDSTVGRFVIGHIFIDVDKNGIPRNKVKRIKPLPA